MSKSKDLQFVSIQFLLFGLYMWSGPFKFNILSTIKNGSFVIVLIAIVIIVLSLIQLNKNLTPFPTPKENGYLIVNGLYRYVRHPIYFGIILFSFSFGIYSQSVWRLMIAFTLFILFIYKSSYEEQLLAQRYKEYILYRRQIRKNSWF